MQPLKLTLKGFRGIRDGLGQDVLTLDFERLADGAELVAIAGANGRGKPCRAWSAWRNASTVGARKRSLGKARSCNHGASA